MDFRKIISGSLALGLLLSGLTDSHAETVSAAAAPTAGKATPAPTPVTLSIHALSGDPAPLLTFNGSEARQQLAVTAHTGDASMPERDVTHEVRYVTQPAGIVEVDTHGFITPLADGNATIRTELDGAASVSIEVAVTHFDKNLPVSFPNDIVPIFTRSGCNAGACHAKASGQNGFSLSLFGYDPDIDFETLVHKSGGRRISPAAPENSLLLLKASGELPHGGGARLEPGSYEYRQLLRWLKAGTPYAPDNDPTVERIEIFPKHRVVEPGGEQQLIVTAFMSDGTRRDITRAVEFESNDEDMTEVDHHGIVHFAEKTGSAAVLARFQEHVDVFSATLPLGGAAPVLPAPNNFIDEEIFSQLGLLGLPASDLTDDSDFLRRVTLDVAGRLPTLQESQQFIKSNDPDKRTKKIDSLLETTDYADFFAGKWSGLLRNKIDRNSDWVARSTHAFHDWIRSSIGSNKPFNEFAAELVVASGKVSENPAVGWYRAVTDPKEQMQDIAQVFLGIRMQCAQCHHHPYERWTQDDYYHFAAFFTTIGRKEIYKLPEEDIIYHNRKPAQMQNPNSGEMLKPALLGTAEPLNIPAERDPRHELADWLRSADNPYLARVTVNRYWKHFFGRGLVEAEDDIRDTNPASHPALLNALAEDFADSGFDLKHLVRTICSSRTYQLSSETNGQNADDEQNFARFYPRRLPAEVLLDSINDIAGTDNSFNRQPVGVRAIALPDDSSNKESEFLTMFGRPQMDSACECERTGEANLGQSLHLINSDTIQQKLTAGGGRAATLAKDKQRSDEERLGEIYFRALARPPHKQELEIASAHLKKKRELSAADPSALPPATAEQQAFEDIIWVVLNTKEFLFNH